MWNTDNFWHSVAVKLYKLLPLVNWNMISEDVNALAGAISCIFECLGEVESIRTGEKDGFF